VLHLRFDKAQRRSLEWPKPKAIGPLIRLHLQIIARLMMELVRASPGLALVYSLQSALRGFQIPAQVYVTAGLIGSVVASIATTPGANAIFDQADLRFYVIAWLVLQVIPILESVVNQIVTMALGENFLHRLNQKLMLAANRVEDLAAFEGENIFNDSTAIRRELLFRPMRFMTGIFSLLTSLIALTTLSGVIIKYAWELPVIAVSLGVIALVLNAWSGRRIWGGNLIGAKHSRMMDYVFSLCYSRDSRQEVRIYGLSDYIENKFTDAFKGMKQVMNKTRREVALANVAALVPHIALLSWLIMVIVGVTHQTAAEVAAVVFLLNGALALQGQVGGFAMGIGNLIAHLAYFQKFYSFTDHLESYLDNAGTTQETTPINSIDSLSFDGCTFRYGTESDPVLTDVSFKAQRGERIAIVGRNGAGKSTLMKLAIGLYRPQQGTVLANHTDLTQVDLRSYWDRCAVCFQDFPKYTLTVGENIAFGDSNAVDELPSLDALGEAKLSYATQLGKEFEGEELSVGQWQRLSVLRSLHFAKNRDLVVLDEPTAAIDPLHEDEIFRHFDEVSAGKLAFFVTHRL
jgi:ATP-binding cassette subfamily B protein